MKTKSRKLTYLTILCFLQVSLLVSCTSTPAQNDSLNQTVVALSVQQTQLALQQSQNTSATVAAQQATIAAQSVLATQLAEAQSASSANAEATAIQQSVNATLQAQQPPANNNQGSNNPPPSNEQNGSSQQPADYDTLLKSANILLYEDMILLRTTKRYAKAALDNMGLNYKDDGNAMGWLKSDLLSGGPDGKGWDLVILALEVRSNISGEYFTYINQALNQGSSVIIEIWYLDQISGGTVSSILSKCGVKVQGNYVGKTGTVNDLLIWPLETGHPILSEPNSGFRFTNVALYWPFWDLGDLMKKTGKKSDTKLLLGTIAQNKNDHGVLTVCMDGRLIIQTFSSHDLAAEEVIPLWENYIYNALKPRLLK
jgi:hypothetical protein